MHLRVVCCLDWRLEVFLYYKIKMLKYIIFQSHTPTFIVEPVFLSVRIHNCKNVIYSNRRKRKRPMYVLLIKKAAGRFKGY